MILLLILVYFVITLIEIWLRNTMEPEKIGYVHDDFQLNLIRENCLSTLAVLKKNRIDCLPFVGNEIKSRTLIVNAIKAIGRTRVLHEEEHYLHLLFTSRTFKLHTDIELYFDTVLNRIHMNFATRSLYTTAFNKRYYQMIKRIYLKYFTIPDDLHTDLQNLVAKKKEE